jgi:hypothetical protein
VAKELRIKGMLKIISYPLLHYEGKNKYKNY